MRQANSTNSSTVFIVAVLMASMAKRRKMIGSNARRRSDTNSAEHVSNRVYRWAAQFLGFRPAPCCGRGDERRLAWSVERGYWVLYTMLLQIDMYASLSLSRWLEGAQHTHKWPR